MKLLFIAGDVSGDIHTALLAGAVAKRHPDWQLHALGGPHLRRAGAHMIGDTSGCGVIGFSSALALLPRVLRLRQVALNWVRAERPDAVVLCDWGAFNGRLLPDLHAAGIPTLYYFPPRSWQKGAMGGLAIAPFVSRAATPFEWSAQRLQAAGCRAEWVGHPLLETVRLSRPRDELRQEFGAPDGAAPLIALLPGSRDLELRLIAPHLAKVARSLKASRGFNFVVAVPRHATMKARRYFPHDVPIFEERSADVLLACDAAIVKSGTATLEAAVAGAPQVVVYDVPALLRAQWLLTGLGRKVPFVAMPNIILERGAVPELLGPNCRPALIERALLELWESQEQRERMRRDYESVRRALGSELPQGATARTVEILEEMVVE